MPERVPIPALAPSLLAAAHAVGVREVRVASISPWIVLLVDAALAPNRADALGDELSALAGFAIEVRPLAALPPWHRHDAWEAAVSLGRGASGS